MDDLLSEFLTETSENLDVVDIELVKFEQNPHDKTVLDNIFRLVHTIKGTCGFLGLPRLEAVAHAGETVLGRFRDGSLTVTEDAVSVILEAIDQIKELLAHLEAEEVEPEGNDDPLIDRLRLAAEGQLGGMPQVVEEDKASSCDDSSDNGAVDEPSAEAELMAEAGQELERPLRPGEVSLDELEAAFQAAEGPAETDVPEAVATTPNPDAGASTDGSQKASEVKSIANQSIRVNVDILEGLMTMVSELVLTRNQLLQIMRGHEDSEFKVPLQRLSNITAELQDGVMKTRMQPIGNAWQKMPRLIRDISRDLGKKIDLQMEGEDTELDRQVLELIKDPLTHMVRNSCDHGLESPDVRRAAGKPEAGRVTLRAYHEGGHIIIEVEDDGQGLNIERIKAKVLANDLATDSELDAMTESQIQKFIFHAGFSTAAQVTNVSGRGVGMDVVRTNIEVIGGSIDLRSAEGKGSTFTIKIPLTLAIVSALIVEAAGFKFAIPQLNVVELVRTGAGSDTVIETVNKTQVMRLRNRLLPLVRLSHLLGLNDLSGDQVEKPEVDVEPREAEFVVVAQVGAQHFGIVVDNVFDTEEIVVKPVASMMRNLSMYSGNTILGDGSVIMIIDPTGISSKVDDDLGDKGSSEEQDRASANADERTSMLLFRTGTEEPKAVPLSLVTRLEEIPVEDIETSNGQNVVQYRGALMPLIQTGGSLRSEGRQPVLVFTDDERAMGLVVDEIVDIVNEVLKIEMTSTSPGLLGTAVIKGKATEIVDVSHYLTMADDSWFVANRRVHHDPQARRVLLVDDNAFFRNMITPLLSAAGYEVTAVDCVEAAWKLHEQGHDFDVILSDIEMPETDGFAFATALKGDERWGSVPLLALSAHNAPEDIEKSLQSGFKRFVSKSDREGLVAVLNETVSNNEVAV